MNKKSARKAEHDSVRKKIDSYQDTVTALICFGHVLTWDDKGKCRKSNTHVAFGRLMNPSTSNKIQSKEPVTPDLVAVCSNDHGIIGEAKITLHGTVDERQGDIRQLVKYDDDLTGWPTKDGKLKSHDIVLLVHYSRKGDTQDLIEEAVKQKQLNLQRKFSAVCFTRAPQADEHFSLEHFYGEMSDQGLQKRMRPLFVPLEKVRPLNPATLYDAAPEPPLLLQLAWDHVFSQLVSEEDYLTLRKQPFEIDCSVDQTRDMLAKACGPAPIDKRDPPIPCRDWVKKMFDLLVKMKLAKCLDKDADKYKVFYRRKALPLDYFIDKYLSIAKKKPKVVRATGVRGRKGSRDHPGQQKMFGL